MAKQTLEFPANLHAVFHGGATFRELNAPAGSIGDAEIENSAAIAATKLIHQHALKYAQAGGTDVVSATVPLHHFRNVATIVSVEVVPIVAPTGGDKEFTVDVQLGNASTAFATILSSVVTVDTSSVARTGQVGVISEDEAADGDTLQVVITASGSTGSQGQGVLVVVTVREES